ncbi:heavy-metal-associated domain-containing protein [Peribacillus glennii]|uniref:Copper chaperone n=1 Tax=Peribacillus glennii TaxID=2303991 RepID=A0A372LDT9_9BACI|nr:heavy-metal-associated domain-containing protein [Peribacillus glennii]RFU63913.1 copper chaperone [Peribacillus glennii]
MEEAVIVIKNMQDQADADRIMSALEDVWGIGRVEVDLSRNRAKLTFDNRMAQLQDFERRLLDNGYEVASGSFEQ